MLDFRTRDDAKPIRQQYQSWRELVEAVWEGQIADEHVWTVLTGCGEVADEGRTDERERLSRENLMDFGPRWRAEMAYCGRNFARFWGDKAIEYSALMEQSLSCADAADEWEAFKAMMGID